MSRLLDLLRKHRTAQAGAIEAAVAMSDLDAARRIAFLLDKAQRTAASMLPRDMADWLVTDTLNRAQELVADREAARLLAECFSEIGQAIAADLA